MKLKDKWCMEYVKEKYVYPDYEPNKGDWLAGFEFARKEAALTANFNGPCTSSHCDCQKVITEAIQVMGEKDSDAGPEPTGEKE